MATVPKAIAVNINAIKGCVLGALLGDACGTSLEFLGRPPTQEEVKLALEMNGGGYFEIASGQYTDDGEMTAALLDTIRACGGRYEPIEVAKTYRRWLLSLPFDIRNATRIALNGGGVLDPDLPEQMMQRAKHHNYESKTNGSMMRATPLAIAAARLSEEMAIDMVARDVGLTHPNPVCVVSTTAYVLAIRQLILQFMDDQGALNIVARYLQKTNTEVYGWYEDAMRGDLPPAYPIPESVRYPFTYAMYHLKHETRYFEAIQHTLMMGGDTNTNACIVGGMVGAYHGHPLLPSILMRRLLRCNTKQGNQHRPEPYTIKRVLENLQCLTI